MELAQNIAGWIRQKADNAESSGIVVGLSGGLDSACVAVLSQMALGENVLGLILPCQSNPEDEKFAYMLADKFNIKTEKLVLDIVYNEFINLLGSKDKLSTANLKPRLRMTALYYFANSLNYIIAGTANKSELMAGYFTKYGDGGVDILPLGGLLKTAVRSLAKELAIPDEITERVPSAGLWEDQTDEGELGISYEELDQAIIAIEEGKTEDFSPAIINKVKKLIDKSEHKRIPISVYKNGGA